MIETKYIIIIGIIICLLILYYFYDEIFNLKKLFMPMYHKTMILEAKIAGLEKKNINLVPNKNPTKKNDSPAYTISYDSDMVKHGNLSVKYADISETEAKELLKNIEHNKTKQLQIQHKNPIIKEQIDPLSNHNKSVGVQSGDMSDFCTVSNECLNKKKNIYNEESDTINLKFTDLIKKKSLENNKSEKYHRILNDLTNNLSEPIQFVNTLSTNASPKQIKKNNKCKIINKNK